MRFEDIPEYYLIEGLPMYNMLYGSEFKTISKEEFIDKYSSFIRSNDPIIDEDDLSYVLFCLSYWSIQNLPKIVLDYIDSHLREDYSRYEEEFLSYYEIIKERVIYISNNYKQIGCCANHTIAIRKDGKLILFNNRGDIEKEYNDEFTAISCTNLMFTALKKDKSIMTFDFIFNTITNKDDDKIIKIACGNQRIVCIRENGTIVPYKNESRNGTFIDVKAGICHFVGLKTDGTVVTWCSTEHKQRNYNPEGKFVKIACGGYHSVGIREDGTIVTWGSNHYNQRNDNPEGKFIDIACGYTHSVGIRENGTVVTWGSIFNHQRNDLPPGKFIKIACGTYSSIGIKEDKTLVSWGFNRKKNCSSDRLF